MNQEEMAVKLIEVEQRSKSNTHRINELAEEIDAVNRLATAVEDLDKKGDAIERKPGKRWDGIVDKFIGGIVGALAAAAFAGIVYLLTVAA